MELLLLLVAALQFVPATGQRRDGEFCVIISDIHKNSLCTQPSIGTLWTGLNHPIAHNPYSLSRVSVPKPRGPTSAPPPQPAGCQLSGGTLLHSLQYHRTKPGKNCGGKVTVWYG